MRHGSNRAVKVFKMRHCSNRAVKFLKMRHYSNRAVWFNHNTGPNLYSSFAMLLKTHFENKFPFSFYFSNELKIVILYTMCAVLVKRPIIYKTMAYVLCQIYLQVHRRSNLFKLKESPLSVTNVSVSLALRCVFIFSIIINMQILC